MKEETDSFVLRQQGDVYFLKAKVLWVEAMMLILLPVILAFFGFILFELADEFVEVASTVLMMGLFAFPLVTFILGRSALVVTAEEVALRLGVVWRRHSLTGVRTCHTKPLPKGHYSLVELEMEHGSRRVLTRLRNGAADRLADLVCELVGAQTPAEEGRAAIAQQPDVDLMSALCTADELVVAQPKSARTPLLRIYSLLERRWAAGRYDPPRALADRLTSLGFRRIGSSGVLWALLPIPMKAATYVNEDGSVVAELLRSEGDKYHFVSYTSTPMVRWSWSKIAPTTKSSEFVVSAATTGSMELDYAKHRDWLADQVRQGAKIATVNVIDDHLTLGRLYARRLASNATALTLLGLPFLLLIPFIAIALKSATS